MADTQDLLDQIEAEQAPDYLAALKNACQHYAEVLRQDYTNRHQPRPGVDARTQIRADVECVRFARGCAAAFARGSFDALFDYQRDFRWHYSSAPA